MSNYICRIMRLPVKGHMDIRKLERFADRALRDCV